MPSNMAANTYHTTLLKDQSAIKYLPWMRFLSNFGCKIIFMRSVNFWYQGDSNSFSLYGRDAFFFFSFLFFFFCSLFHLMNYYPSGQWGIINIIPGISPVHEYVVLCLSLNSVWFHQLFFLFYPSGHSTTTKGRVEPKRKWISFFFRFSFISTFVYMFFILN